MKKIATGTVTALLIAATTSLAMAQDQHSKRYYNYDNSTSGGQTQDYNTSPGSTNAGIAQER
jgi:hypothetical protein